MKLLRFPLFVVLATGGTLAIGALRSPISPDLLLLPVADTARRGGAVRAMLAGLLVGLIDDVLRTPPRLLGLHAFSKILVGYLLATVAARTIVEKPLAVSGVLAAAVVLESLSIALLLWLLRGEPLLPEPLALVLRAGVTGAAGAALHAASRFPWRARFSRRSRRWA